MKIANLLKFLQIAVGVGLLGGILSSPELWFSMTRTFPRAPLIFAAPVALEQILSLFLSGSLIFNIFSSRRRMFSILAVVALILLICSDQNRLQPWVYQYLLLLITLTLRKAEDEQSAAQILGLAQILIAGLYIWSGLQKLNFSFFHETLPALLSPFGVAHLVWLGLGAALIETIVGVGLLLRRTRNFSICLAVVMHTIILGLLVAKNYNSVVWSWNAVLIVLVVIAFRRTDVSDAQIFRHVRGWKMMTATSIAAASVFLPVLSFCGYWDVFLSGALYSGRTEIAVIRINESLLEKLPPTARQIVFQTENDGEKMLPLFEWAMIELNVPVYPEERVFRQAAREVCKLADTKINVELIIKQRPSILDGSYKVSRISCAKL